MTTETNPFDLVTSVSATKDQVLAFRRTIFNYVLEIKQQGISTFGIDVQEIEKIPLVTNHIVNPKESEDKGFQRVYTFALPDSITYRSIESIGKKENPYDMFIDVIWDENTTPKEVVEDLKSKCIPHTDKDGHVFYTLNYNQAALLLSDLREELKRNTTG